MSNKCSLVSYDGSALLSSTTLSRSSPICVPLLASASAASLPRPRFAHGILLFRTCRVFGGKLVGEHSEEHSSRGILVWGNTGLHKRHPLTWQRQPGRTYSHFSFIAAQQCPSSALHPLRSSASWARPSPSSLPVSAAPREKLGRQLSSTEASGRRDQVEENSAPHPD